MSWWEVFSGSSELGDGSPVVFFEKFNQKVNFLDKNLMHTVNILNWYTLEISKMLEVWAVLTEQIGVFVKRKDQVNFYKKFHSFFSFFGELIGFWTWRKKQESCASVQNGHYRGKSVGNQNTRPFSSFIPLSYKCEYFVDPKLRFCASSFNYILKFDTLKSLR